MSQCYGTDGGFQAQCGSGLPHDRHPYDEIDAACPGTPAGFIADCGEHGPHGEHPMKEDPR